MVGGGGHLVGSADPDALADAIIALLQDEATRRRLGETGRRIAAESYDQRHQVDRIAAILSERLTQRPATP